MNASTPKPGFKVAHGPNKNRATGALIFDEAKTEAEARRLFKEYVENTYPVKPEGFKTICYILPLSETRSWDDILSKKS